MLEKGGGQVVNNLLHRMPEAWQALGIGRTTLYELIADGKIKTVKIGRRVLIPDDELQRFVATLPRQDTVA
jgi:excisionase family DNA binding protein